LLCLRTTSPNAIALIVLEVNEMIGPAWCEATFTSLKADNSFLIWV